MKVAAGIIATLKNEQISDILSGKNVEIDVEGQKVELNTEKIIVERTEKEDLKVLNDGTITIGLETKVTDELKKEGYVRDLIRGIQSIRKDQGLTVQDKINLKLSGDSELKSAYEMFASLISTSTLTNEQSWVEKIDDANEIEADDKIWRICVAKA